MIRALRWLLSGVVVVAVLAGLGIAYLFYGLPAERIVEDLRSDLSEALGQEVTIEGEAKAILLPWPGIAFGPVRIEGAKETGGSALVSAESGLLTLSADDIKAGALKARTLHLADANLLIARREDGSVNWPWMPGGGEPALSALHLSNARLVFQDESLSDDLQVEGARAHVSFDGPAQPASISGVWTMGRHSGTGAVRIGNLGDLMSGRWSRLSADLASDAGRLTWRGRLALDRAAGRPIHEGDLSGQTSLGQLADWLGLPAERLRRLADDAEVKLDARMTSVPDRLRLDVDLASMIDGRDVTMDVRLAGDQGWMREGGVTLNSVTRVAGLASGYLDGVITPAHSFEGSVAASTTNFPELASWAGVKHPAFIAVPRTFGIKGPVDLASGLVTLRDAEVVIESGQQVVNLEYDFSGPNHLVRLAMVVAEIDLSEILSVSRASPGIELTWLADIPYPGIDVDVDVEAASARIGAIEAGLGTYGLQLREEIRTARIQKMRVFDGEVSGSLLLGALGPEAAALEVQAGGVDVEAALHALGEAGLSGAGEGVLRLVVPDMSTPMPWSNASGEAEIAIFGGEIGMSDLFGAAEGDDVLAPSTRFSVFSSDMRIEDNRVSADRLRLTNAEIEMEGKLALDLTTLGLDGRLSPPASSEKDRFPVAIAGTLSAPDVVTQWSEPIRAVAPEPQSEQQETGQTDAAVQAGPSDERGPDVAREGGDTELAETGQQDLSRAPSPVGPDLDFPIPLPAPR